MFLRNRILSREIRLKGSPIATTDTDTDTYAAADTDTDTSHFALVLSH